MSDVKSIVKILSVPLYFLINLSISTGIVPEKIKIVRAVPVYKSDNPSLFCNKTLRSVHFGVVVVELINCKCGGIARNQIW